MQQIDFSPKVFSVDFPRTQSQVILNNALKHKFIVKAEISSSQQINTSSLQNNAESMENAYTMKTPDNLYAVIKIRNNSIDLEPGEPYILKLHIDEIEPSIDYSQYVTTLLNLCDTIEIDSLRTLKSI